MTARTALKQITAAIIVAQSSVANLIEDTLSEAVESGDHETADHLLNFLRSVAELEHWSMKETPEAKR